MLAAGIRSVFCTGTDVGTVLDRHLHISFLTEFRAVSCPAKENHEITTNLLPFASWGASFYNVHPPYSHRLEGSPYVKQAYLYVAGHTSIS